MTIEKGWISLIVVRWRIILVLVSVIKLMLMAWAPTYGDLFNWAEGANLVLGFLSAGRLPSVSATGAYGPLQLVLSPFFWLWTKLPIDHPSIFIMRASSQSASTLSAVSLIFLLKLPTFLADVAIGVLLFQLVRRITSSDQNGMVAFLLWYANPFNIFWIEVFGGMDVIPTLVLMLAVVVGSNREWFKSGFCVAVATVLRIFPILTFPFFVLAVKGGRTRAYAFLFSGFLLPLIGGAVVLYITGAGTIVSMLNTPLRESWLLDFLGFKLTNQYVRLVPVLLAIQFYVVIRYWKEPRLIHLVAVSLLALLVAHTYSGINHHFIWVVPFLTASVAINHNELWLFIVTFVTASLYPFIFPLPAVPLVIDIIHFFDPFYAGCFYAAKAAYLITINFKNIRP